MGGLDRLCSQILAAVYRKAERCHNQHPNACLIFWSAASFQVTERILQSALELAGIAAAPFIMTLF